MTREHHPLFRAIAAFHDALLEVGINDDPIVQLPFDDIQKVRDIMRAEFKNDMFGPDDVMRHFDIDRGVQYDGVRFEWMVVNPPHKEPPLKHGVHTRAGFEPLAAMLKLDGA